MPRVGFETTISAFEREKTVHALDRTEAVIGNEPPGFIKYLAILNYLSD
jgi:hypothetical protein